VEYQHSQWAAQAICDAADRVANRIIEAVSYMDLPSYLFKPKLSIDGDYWCALYGSNLQDGIAGFGKSPAEAYADFDNVWYEKLRVRE